MQMIIMQINAAAVAMTIMTTKATTRINTHIMYPEQQFTTFDN